MKRYSILLCLAVLLPPPVFAQFGLGKLKKALDVGQSLAEMNISEEDEIALGEAISAKIRAVYGVQQDVEETRYVSLVGLVVAAKSSRPNLPYRFFVLDSGQINAFAAPGGFIHITRGALASMKDEAELAGVLGHEIAHVTEKHTLNEIKKLKGIQLAEGQTSLAGNPEVLDRVADTLTEAILKGFGRKEELESDHVGLQFAANTGYDPEGLVRFLQQLKVLNEGGSERAGLFASHPETDERIKRLDKQISKDKLLERTFVSLPGRYQDSIRYEVVVGEIGPSAAEGSRGLASGGGKEGEGKESEEGEKKEEKKSRFSLGKLNPLSSGEKKQTSAVTGSAGSRAVGKEGEEESGPKNPNPVEVNISKADLDQFRREGNLPGA